MTWTNAFDAGQCTVKVFGPNDMTTVLFSQVMAKGDSATYTDDFLGVATVAVDTVGAVSLSADGPAQSGGGEQWTLCVTPSVAPTSACRIRALTCDVTTYGTATVTAYGNMAAAGIDIASDMTPDPCDLPGAVEFALQGIGAAV